MKLTKWLAAAATVAVAGGVGVINVGSANAAGPTFTAVHGSISCNIGGKGTVTPALAGDWKQSDHQADPNTDPVIADDVATIPDTRYSVDGPVALGGTLKSSHCSGTATDNSSDSAAITGATLGMSLSFGAGNPATCTALVDLFTGGESPTVTTTVTWKATGATVNPTTITSTLTVASSPPPSSEPGFKLTATSVSGSFGGAGATSTIDAYVDPNTVNAFVAGLIGPNTTAPDAGICDPTIGVKVKPAAAGAAEGVSIKLKKPKTLKSIVFCPCTSATDSNAAQSDLAVSHA